jgi:L-lactate dehydrogenase (cytochrome)
MAGGERGVARAGELLRKEAVRTMQLLGVRRIDDLDERRARLRDR